MSTRLSEPFVQVNDLTYHYEDKRAFALQNLSFTLEKGNMLVILGPSGSGKSTLLQLIAGLLRPDGGHLVMNGTEIGRLPPEKRRLSMVFQKPYLLPFLSVGHNVEVGLKLQGKSAGIRRAQAEDILHKVGLAGFYNRSISSLSGGQEQRVALARSLVIEPQLLLLDEPFSQLDPMLRGQMGEWLGEIKRQVTIPMILVTHDREEALTLGDQFLILRDGSVQQWGSVEDVYYRPANRWVAEFMGFDNVLKGNKQGDTILTALGPLEIEPKQRNLPDGPVYVVVRSEWLNFDSASTCKGNVSGSTFRGEYTEVKICAGGEFITVKQLGFHRYEPGKELGIGYARAVAWCISPQRPHPAN